MKKQNIKYLKDYEQDMITALFHSYTRQIPTATLMEIDDFASCPNRSVYCSLLGNGMSYLYISATPFSSPF